MEIVSGGAGVLVDELTFEGTVDENGELARRRGVGLRFADARGQPTIERAEGQSACGSGP